jgi:AraC-like DNA-binding protein
MSLEIRPSRLLSRSLAVGGERAEPHTGADPTAWQEVISLLAAVEELIASRDTDGMLRRSVELARDRLGLERVGLYLRDPKEPRLIFRGTWGTGAQGETTDEHGLHYECSPEDYEALRCTQQNGALWLYFDHARHFAEAEDRTTVIGQGWIVATPLASQGEVVGVMFNDTALSHTPVDPAKQARAAVFCGLIANLFVNRRDGLGWRPLPEDAGGLSLAQRALRALEKDPVVTGERIAEELGVSPGHLARSFKSEMGLSLVEYRNRLRIERFLRSVQSGNDSLLRAALEAGFGSYAQFFRVYRKLLGTTPREHLGARSTRAARARRIWQDGTAASPTEGISVPVRRRDRA